MTYQSNKGTNNQSITQYLKRGIGIKKGGKDMKATIELTKRTFLEEAIANKDNSALISLIERKEEALGEAQENAEFYRSIGNAEFADNEQTRANHLMRELKSLRAAI